MMAFIPPPENKEAYKYANPEKHMSSAEYEIWKGLVSNLAVVFYDKARENGLNKGLEEVQEFIEQGLINSELRIIRLTDETDIVGPNGGKMFGLSGWHTYLGRYMPIMVAEVSEDNE